MKEIEDFLRDGGKFLIGMAHDSDNVFVEPMAGDKLGEPYVLKCKDACVAIDMMINNEAV